MSCAGGPTRSIDGNRAGQRTNAHRSGIDDQAHPRPHDFGARQVETTPSFQISGASPAIVGSTPPFQRLDSMTIRGPRASRYRPLPRHRASQCRRTHAFSASLGCATSIVPKGLRGLEFAASIVMECSPCAPSRRWIATEVLPSFQNLAVKRASRSTVCSLKSHIPLARHVGVEERQKTCDCCRSVFSRRLYLTWPSYSHKPRQDKS